MKGLRLVLCLYPVGKGLGSPEIVPSQSMLKAFDGHVFKPHGIVPSFPVTQGGKTVNVEVELSDAPIDYNLLLD